jgi:hypothetical protein
MPEDQLKAFWEAIQADASLQQRLQGCMMGCRSQGDVRLICSR